MIARPLSFSMLRRRAKRGAAMFDGMERLGDLLRLYGWLRFMLIHDPSAFNDLVLY